MGTWWHHIDYKSFVGFLAFFYTHACSCLVSNTVDTSWTPCLSVRLPSWHQKHECHGSLENLQDLFGNDPYSVWPQRYACFFPGSSMQFLFWVPTENWDYGFLKQTVITCFMSQRKAYLYRWERLALEVKRPESATLIHWFDDDDSFNF